MIIANFHEIYNFLNTCKIEKKIKTLIFKENYLKILKVMQPVLPHMISECLSTINEKIDTVWPEIDKKYLSKKSNTIVVQFNGKKRGLLECENDINEDNLIELVKKEMSLKNISMIKKSLEKFMLKIN